MQVRNCLSAFFTDVEHQTVATVSYALGSRHVTRKRNQVVEDAVVRHGDVIDTFEVTLRNDEYVHRRFWCDVVKRKRGVALGDDLRGYLPRDYFAEKAVTHLVLSSLLILRAVQRKSPVTSLEGQKRRRNHTRGLCS